MSGEFITLIWKPSCNCSSGGHECASHWDWNLPSGYGMGACTACGEPTVFQHDRWPNESVANKYISTRPLWFTVRQEA